MFCGRNFHINSSEILTNLKTLGLDSGATPDDIHAVFRKLALELHPDVTGSRTNYRFQQVTAAYTALKNLTPEELKGLPVKKSTIYDYYSAEKSRRNDAKLVDDILTKYEQEIKEYYSGYSDDDSLDIKAVTFRMKSSNPKVINAVLKHSGHLVNKVEFRKALAEILKRPEIDEETANITASLPFDDMTRKLIALDAAGSAGNFPPGLIISLIGDNSDVMESMLLHVQPDDVAVIMRRWPSGKIMTAGIIRTLLDSEDPRVLVPVMSAMKTNFPKSASQHEKRLTRLTVHSSAAVRAWARKLL